MTAKKEKQNLGKGLAALLGDEAETYQALENNKKFKVVPIEFLHPNPNQPRRYFNEEELQNLADSIRENGIIQPITVRQSPDSVNSYEIIAGERRWRAAQLAAEHEVPVFIQEHNDQDVLKLALIENIQRQDLTPVEEGESFQRLMDEFDLTQEEVATSMGKSRSYVANHLRILRLPDNIKQMIQAGTITAGHARTLITAKDPEQLAEQIIKQGLNVREAESLIKKNKKTNTHVRKSNKQEKDPNAIALEESLEKLLGMKVNIEIKGAKGAVTIHYGSLDQLDDIIHRLQQTG